MPTKKAITRKRPKKSLAADKLLDAVKAGSIEPVYYFYATQSPSKGYDKEKASPFNDFLLSRAVDAIMAKVVDSNPKDMNFSSFIGGEAKLEEVIAVAQTYPMMRERRLIIVKDAQNFRSGDWDFAFRYLENPSPLTCLVFIGEHFPTRNKGGEKARQALFESATAVSFKPFRNTRELAPFFTAELRKRKVKMTPDAKALLFDMIGADLTQLLQTLDKIMLYIGDGGEITASDVAECVAQTKAANVYALMDALAERRLALALNELKSILTNATTTDEMMLMGSLNWLYSDLKTFREALDKGLSRAEIKKTTPGNAWAVEKRLNQAGRLSSKQVALMMDALHDCDKALHEARTPNHVLFERFVMRACLAR